MFPCWQWQWHVTDGTTNHLQVKIVCETTVFVNIIIFNYNITQFAVNFIKNSQ